MKIKEIIENRNKMTDEANSARLAWQKKLLSQRARESYTDKYRIETLKKELDTITETEYDANRTFNLELVKEIDKLITEETAKLTPTFDKPADYAVRIANAMELLKALPLTESNVEMAIKPFKADYEQMLIFDRLVESMDQHACIVEKRQPYYYEETFGQTRAITDRLAEFEEIREIAKELFVHYKTKYEETMYDLIPDERIVVETLDDGYDERAGQARILAFLDSLRVA